MSTRPTTLPARIKQTDVPDLYKATAPVYDLWGRLTETKARQRCLELARIRDGETVLEVAVGTGLTFAEILKRNPTGRNEGIDLTPAMLERAEQRAAQTGARNYQLRVGDAYQLEFADNTFDLVVNNFMFDLLPEKDFSVVLAEFKRVLRSPDPFSGRPGGRLVLVNMAQGERWYNGLWKIVYRINPAWIGGCRSVALLNDVRSLGFQDTRREYLSQMTFPAEIVYGVKS
ncbi:MAG TPA: methyltransferase domain-containing protein [Anaerolineae bacterium]